MHLWYVCARLVQDEQSTSSPQQPPPQKTSIYQKINNKLKIYLKPFIFVCAPTLRMAAVWDLTLSCTNNFLLVVGLLLILPLVGGGICSLPAWLHCVQQPRFAHFILAAADFFSLFVPFLIGVIYSLTETVIDTYFWIWISSGRDKGMTAWGERKITSHLRKMKSTRLYSR